MLNRRTALAMLSAAAAAPTLAFAPDAPVRKRLSFDAFRRTPDYGKFVGAIRKMRANSDHKSPDSWLYWANIHALACPHGKPYFLAWHRGYLTLFERKLREIAKSNTLMLPYWDYYSFPDLPLEFRSGSAATNPLWADRRGSSVKAALVYTPFYSDYSDFERGKPMSFEAACESQFHNNIHNLVGGKMATMQSPQDPIFWLHHANVDRLWAAWVASGEGRVLPAAGDPYWGGEFSYAAGVTLPRRTTRDTSLLGYSYAELELPFEDFIVGAAAPPRAMAAPPPMLSAPPPPRTGAGHAAGAAPPPMPVVPPSILRPRDEPPMFGTGSSLTLRDSRQTIRLSLGLATRESPSAGAAPRAARKPLTVVFDEVTLTRLGADGGFFYNIYAVPAGENAEHPSERYLLGSLGTFQIEAALMAAHGGGGGGGMAHNGVMLPTGEICGAAAAVKAGMAQQAARIEMPATEVIREAIREGRADSLSLVFVRIDADGAPAGATMKLNGFRVEGEA